MFNSLLILIDCHGDGLTTRLGFICNCLQSIAKYDVSSLILTILNDFPPLVDCSSVIVTSCPVWNTISVSVLSYSPPLQTL